MSDTPAPKTAVINFTIPWDLYTQLRVCLWMKAVPTPYKVPVLNEFLDSAVRVRAQQLTESNNANLPLKKVLIAYTSPTVDPNASPYPMKLQYKTTAGNVHWLKSMLLEHSEINPQRANLQRFMEDAVTQKFNELHKEMFPDRYKTGEYIGGPER